MSVSISAGVRSALSSLQSTAAAAQASQLKLATGKKVNSAVDNPVNFFTAASLNNRSSQLTGLLDGISNGIQTIQAASKGIDGITKLVSSLQSTIKQAQADAAQNRPTISGTSLATASEAGATSKSLKDIALDKRLGDDATPDPATAGAFIANTATAATASSAGDLGFDTRGTATAANTANKMVIHIGKGAATGTDLTKIELDIDKNTTVRDVVNAINGSGVATAFVDEKGQLNVKGTGSEKLSVGIGLGGASDVAGPPAVAAADGARAAAEASALGGTQNALFGLATGDRTSGKDSSNVTSATRSNLIDQYNDLRGKIDDLAKDAGYNGINLLGGDRLSIAFNEKGGKNQTKLDIQGNSITSDNLGLVKAGNTQLAGQVNFQNDLDLEKATESLTGALNSLKSFSSSLGANLSVAQTRQDFTKDMADVLSTGASNLVNVDANAEAASLLALQTRQQLSQTALSLSNQSEQAVLRMF